MCLASAATRARQQRQQQQPSLSNPQKVHPRPMLSFVLPPTRMIFLLIRVILSHTLLHTFRLTRPQPKQTMLLMLTYDENSLSPFFYIFFSLFCKVIYYLSTLHSPVLSSLFFIFPLLYLSPYTYTYPQAKLLYTTCRVVYSSVSSNHTSTHTH